MSKSKFYDQIHTAQNERQVEDVYNEGLKYYFKIAEIKYPFDCDGFIDTKTVANKYLKLIIEYKYNENLATPADRARVLVQVLFYLHKFETDGQILPNVILIGDINECFVLHTNDICNYLDEQVDWSVAPSQAADKYPQFVLKIANNQNINPFVFQINDSFSFKNVFDKICDLADNVQRYVRVTEHNISSIYNYFTDNVIQHATKVDAHDLVEIFLGTIADRENYFQNPENPSFLMANGKKISINGGAFKSFFGYFNRDYTMAERNRFAEIADRLIEDTNRRRNGDFFTPTSFVDYAHKMLAEQLGNDWKEKYVVWDCCWGTGNLTRDYRFNELYASTLKESELQIGEHYNSEATKFQMDFLNDPIEPDLYGTKVPQGLLIALKEDKPIVFFINPPYGTPSSGGANTKHKEGCSESIVHTEMMAAKIGSCSQNMYTQFLYRILRIKQDYHLTKVAIGLYSPTLFLSGPSFISFRKIFLEHFEYQKACTFQASHFSDVADSWGISFSVWTNGKTSNKNDFYMNPIDFKDGQLVDFERICIYNMDNAISASDWVNSKKKVKKDIEMITAKSSLNLSNMIKKVSENKGYFANDTNNVDANVSGVYFMTMPISRHVSTVEIQEDNFYKCVTLFAARKLIIKDWINSKFEYIAPNEQHKRWQEFVNDSIVFALFENSSNQSSLRNIEHLGKKWNIKNEFFFMSKQRIMELADANKSVSTYEDARTDSERYVYKLISGHENLVSETLSDKRVVLSAEAKAVLDKAIELTEKTFPYRGMFNQSHPEYQIMNWDCGWYQIKAVVGEYFKNDLTEFQQLYKTLSDKMRPMVYELGFLK